MCDRIRVYTDGACSLHPYGDGGWAWAVDLGFCPEYVGVESSSGAVSGTTNQRMEIMAAFEALKALGPDVEIVSDSKYVVDCFNARWYAGWLRRGWVASNRKPVANRDLWEPFFDLYLPHRDRTIFSWVRGHNGNAMNDLVDALAVEAKRSLRSRSKRSLRSR